MVLAVGAALMALIGILFPKEPATWPRLLGMFFRSLGCSSYAIRPVGESAQVCSSVFFSAFRRRALTSRHFRFP
jgi:hypothetical protein